AAWARQASPRSTGTCSPARSVSTCAAARPRRPRSRSRPRSWPDAGVARAFPSPRWAGRSTPGEVRMVHGGHVEPAEHYARGDVMGDPTQIDNPVDDSRTWEDQRSTYDALRARCPVAHEDGRWVVLRHAKVVEAA